MTTYKLTRQDNTTFGGCLWGEGVTHETDGIGGLCGAGWLHAYSHPLIAVFMNLIHAGIENPKLWECLGEGRCLDDNGLKCGFTRLTTVREIQLPEVTTVQRVAFGILCAMEVCKDPEWTAWANNWLGGADRTSDTARAAAYAVADAAARVADGAVRSARAAALAVDEAAWAADESAYWAASAAARTVAGEAAWMAADSADLDIVSLAQKAMEY